MSAPVVVAVDGTDDGRRALALGIRLATMYDARLRLVHVRHQNVVLNPMIPLFPEPALDEIAATVLREALEDAARLGWQGEPPETVLAHAPRVPAIVDSARDARCVVLGTRSAPGRHLFTGSTSNGVAANCDVPVVCVPQSWDPGDRSHRIVVGVDSGDDSAHLVEAASMMAELDGARVEVVHAWLPSGQYDAAVSGRAFEQRWEDETRPVIEKLVDPVRTDHPGVRLDVSLRFERPVVALHELSGSSDLIVVGRHGHHPRFTPALGTTTRTVIRTSECPVLVVPH